MYKLVGTTYQDFFKKIKSALELSSMEMNLLALPSSLVLKNIFLYL